MTKEERESIINEAVERTLLRIPDVVGNLITNYAAKMRVNKEFYDKYPEFVKHKELVASAIESTEGTDPTLDYQEIVDRAVPKIRERMNSLRNVDTKKVEKPDISKKLDFGQGEI